MTFFLRSGKIDQNWLFRLENYQKNQKMAYVQKLYNRVYMHMRCCSEDLRYVTLKMLGNASKKFTLEKFFDFFSDAHFFDFFLTFVWLFLIKDWLFIDFLRIYTIWTYAIFWIFWNDFMNKQSTKSQEKVKKKWTKSQPKVNFFISKSHLKSQSWVRWLFSPFLEVKSIKIDFSD